MSAQNPVLPLPSFVWDDVILPALKEDWGRRGDITTRALFDSAKTCEAKFISREDGIFCGAQAILHAMKTADPTIEILLHTQDGDAIHKGEEIATVRGPVIGILEAERVALNLASRLTSIATKTAEYCAAIAGGSAKICCTRKTTPLLRALEKYAVACGGGVNHRFGLDDAVLIKDNHIAVAGGIVNAIDKIRERVGHMVKIEVEVDTLDQFAQILDQKIDAVLLDNMTPEHLKKAVAMNGGRFMLEASGGVNLGNIAAIAECGVDLISCGALTHSVENFDIGLDIK